MLTQRLGSDTQKDPVFLAGFIAAVQAHPGCCDEVWLATDYGFPRLETHRRAAEVLAGTAEQLRKVGLRVSLQLSNSIGHGEYMSSQDCSGLVFEGSPVEHMVGHNGSIADYCFCWNGRHFREYTFAALREYLRRIQPHCLWVDDDLRASNHAPVEFGCFCDDCMARFNARYGSNFTREELVREICSGDVAWREKHIQFLRDGLEDFVAKMGKVVHEEAPDCRMGFQYAAHGEYTGYDYSFILDAMYKSTGYPPCTRPGGGSYNDHDPNAFIMKSEFLDMQNRMLPDYVQDKRPEIENLPDIVFGKSIGGTCFETSYYLASGNTAMSYAMLMNDYEPMSWHGEMLAAFAAHRAYWEKLSAGSKDSVQAGWTLAMSKVGYLAEADSIEDYSHQPYNVGLPYRFMGISIAMKDHARPDEVHLLHSANARRMSDAELASLLATPVITDAETLLVLRQRGFDLSVDAEAVDCLKLSERFTDHPVNKGAEGRLWCGQFANSAGYALTVLDPEKVEILSEYVKIVPANTPEAECVPVANHGIKKYARLGKCASAIVETPAGAKWAIFGFDAWQRGVSTEKRNQYLEASAYISGARQPAEIVTPSQALLQSRIDAEGRLTQASITNITVAASGPLVVQLSNPASEKVVFMGQYAPTTELSLIPTDHPNVFTVEIPSLNAWSIGTLFCR